MVDIDPMGAVEGDDDEKDSHDTMKAKLNSAVAISVAVLATFMGICKVKDDNICQAMQQAQADKIDHWGWYQAHDTREAIFASQASILTAQHADEAVIAVAEKAAKTQADKKATARTEAEADQKAYDESNYRDDQFDLSDAMIAIAISLFALTSLTQKRWLFMGALAPTLFGVLMGMAGLFGWHLHSDTLASWLS
jgi:hypothetical protein